MLARLIWGNRVYGDDGKSGLYIHTEEIEIDEQSDIAKADGFCGCEKLEGNSIRVVCRFQYPMPPEQPPWGLSTQIVELPDNSPAFKKCDFFPELLGIERDKNNL